MTGDDSTGTVGLICCVFPLVASMSLIGIAIAVGIIRIWIHKPEEDDRDTLTKKILGL
jgi:hypothetical protein